MKNKALVLLSVALLCSSAYILFTALDHSLFIEGSIYILAIVYVGVVVCMAVIFVAVLAGLFNELVLKSIRRAKR